MVPKADSRRFEDGAQVVAPDIRPITPARPSAGGAGRQRCTSPPPDPMAAQRRVGTKGVRLAGRGVGGRADGHVNSVLSGPPVIRGGKAIFQASNYRTINLPGACRGSGLPLSSFPCGLRARVPSCPESSAVATSVTPFSPVTADPPRTSSSSSASSTSSLHTGAAPIPQGLLSPGCDFCLPVIVLTPGLTLNTHHCPGLGDRVNQRWRLTARESFGVPQLQPSSLCPRPFTG